MRLVFRVLWIDDDRDWTDSISDRIEDVIAEHGLSVVFEKARSGSEIGDYNGYNLILMDLNLAEGAQGQELIKQIRSTHVYTEVVLYSASGIKAVMKQAAELGLEGVYFADRSNFSFLDKIKEVVSTTLFSFQDLVNLRGLVMAEVSELDVMMESIILQYFTKEDRINEFHRHVTKDKEDSIKRSLSIEKCERSCKLKWFSAPFDKIVPRLDSSNKAHAINIVLNSLSNDNEDFKEYAGLNFVDEYGQRIIDKRNSLAHCVETKGPNGEMVLKARSGDLAYTEEKIIVIRKDIQFYQSLFKKILDALL